VTSSGLNRLLIVRTSAMGDILHALPAVAALRRSLPETSIGWVVEERWVELLCAPSTALVGLPSTGRPLVDRIHTVNTKGWRRSLTAFDTWRQISESVRELRTFRYQAAIDFQGSVRSAFIARLSGANSIYGFAHPREGTAKMFYSKPIAAKGAHVIEQNLSLAESFTGNIPAMNQAELPRDDKAERDCDQFLKKHQLEKFVVLNPGAGWDAKQWPAERYGEIAQQLSQDGMKCLINFGPGEEALAEAARTSSQGCAMLLGVSLTELIAFTRRAALFIGGDTGPMHLAATLEIPVVALFGPTDPARNGPFGTSKIVLRSPASLTSHKRNAPVDPGLLAITVDEVVASARQLLKEPRG
jgi:heptosyltransferase-1